MLSDILPIGFEIGVQYGRVKPGDTVAVVGAGRAWALPRSPLRGLRRSHRSCHGS